MSKDVNFRKVPKLLRELEKLYNFLMPGGKMSEQEMQVLAGSDLFGQKKLMLERIVAKLDEDVTAYLDMKKIHAKDARNINVIRKGHENVKQLKNATEQWQGLKEQLVQVQPALPSVLIMSVLVVWQSHKTCISLVVRVFQNLTQYHLYSFLLLFVFLYFPILFCNNHAT
jgi:hypothetical protein